MEIYSDAIDIRARKRDGRRYVHRFGRGVRIVGHRDGSVTLRQADGLPLWDRFSQEGGDVEAFLINPPRRGRGGRFVKGKAGRKARARARRSRRTRRNPSLSIVAAPAGNPRGRRKGRGMARRRRKGTARRRAFRRNPAGVGGLGGLLMDGATMAGGDILGTVAVNQLARFLPAVAGTPMVRRAAKAGVAIAIRQFGGRFLGSRMANSLALGMLAGVIGEVARETLLPAVGIGADMTTDLGADIPELTGAELGAYFPGGDGGAEIESQLDAEAAGIFQ